MGKHGTDDPSRLFAIVCKGLLLLLILIQCVLLHPALRYELSVVEHLEGLPSQSEFTNSREELAHLQMLFTEFWQKAGKNQ